MHLARVHNFPSLTLCIVIWCKADRAVDERKYKTNTTDDKLTENRDRAWKGMNKR